MDAIAWKQSVGEPRVIVSRRALLHNARLIRRHLSPQTRVCAIIKADAYGHGAGIVADVLCNCSNSSRQSALSGDDRLGVGSPVYPASSADPAVDALAVASLDEAAALPIFAGGLGGVDTDGAWTLPWYQSSGEDALPEHAAPGFVPSAAPVPVLILRPIENVFLGRQRAKLEEAVRQGWVLTLCSPAAADDLARIAVSCGRRAAVQVMVDSGMTRSGVRPGEIPALLAKIESRSSLRLTGLCTHFASADEPGNSFTAEQLSRFRNATDAHADRLKLHRHAANSGAVFFSPTSHLDMVRPGLALYGIDPSGQPSLDRPLQPALKWTAPLVGVKEIPAGETVGYGQTWRATYRTRVGLIPVGYADGYPRLVSNRGVVMVHGRSAPVIGRVSMDLTTIDLTQIPQAVVGDEATLLDSDPSSPASVYRLAEWAETIPYEIFSRIGPRVRRVAYDVEDDSPRMPEKHSTTRPDLA